MSGEAFRAPASWPAMADRAHRPRRRTGDARTPARAGGIRHRPAGRSPQARAPRAGRAGRKGPARATQPLAALSLVLMLSKVVLAVLPSVVTMLMTATRIRASITA